MCSAMLYEQAAFCALYTSPPQLRKFAFRLIVAGNAFVTANQVGFLCRLSSPLVIDITHKRAPNVEQACTTVLFVCGIDVRVSQLGTH